VLEKVGSSGELGSFVARACTEKKIDAYGVGVTESAGENPQTIWEHCSIKRIGDELLRFRCGQVGSLTLGFSLALLVRLVKR
jgi:hypothetical protein|tara:strand:- start:1735 stop:1980 length:246 start_codon:yes stop_codon:yes gene_type:complete